MLPEDQEPGLPDTAVHDGDQGARGPGGSHRRESRVPSGGAAWAPLGAGATLRKACGLSRWTPGSNPGSFAPRLCGVSTDAPLRRRPIPLLRPSKTTRGEQAVRTATSPLWTAGPGSQTRTAGSAQRVIRGQPPAGGAGRPLSFRSCRVPPGLRPAS